MISTVQTGRHAQPIGYQSFADLRQDGCYYVDKTPLIRQMIDEGRYCFLSRPRRFGKSQLVDTLQELFEGNEPLFRGLDIHPHWDWSVKHPVVRLTLDGTVSTPESLEKNVLNQLHEIVLAFDLESLPPVTDSPNRLRSILTRLHQATGQQAVVLVDEHDKPVLDVLEDDEKAKANRDSLREIYSILKSAQKHIRFVFVTGITMFPRTGFLQVSTISRTSACIPATHRFAAIPIRIWIRYLLPSWKGWTGTRFANGTTATAGWARTSSTIPTTSFICSTFGNSGLTGSGRDSPAACTGCC